MSGNKNCPVLGFLRYYLYQFIPDFVSNFDFIEIIRDRDSSRKSNEYEYEYFSKKKRIRINIGIYSLFDPSIRIRFDIRIRNRYSRINNRKYSNKKRKRIYFINYKIKNIT